MDAEDGRGIFRVQKWDEGKLRMFAISVLWRAANTTLEYFRKAKIGTNNERLTKLILAGIPGSPDDFSMILGRWITDPANKQWAGGQAAPAADRFHDEGVVWFYFGGGWMCVKHDPIPFSPPVSNWILRPNRPIDFLAQPLEASKLMAQFSGAHDRVHKKNKPR
jgi:hypothetical protein